MMNEFENPTVSEDEDVDYTPDLISLEDEDGNSYEFEIAGTLEIDGETYMALIPAPTDAEDAVQDSGELVILRVLDDEDGTLEAIEDEDLFNQVAAAFMEELSDTFEFDEEDDEQEGEEEK
ncbi:MAG: DUF1292 domain-containing protein [Oscillospiraceae bacterium]